ncbi:protoporphyrinogen/coproporphyrinogen oxidase [Actinoplanes rectilineatus]|uniref:protoporphyrinogen/coproporphyrinogen oxidase n=1 Tax=Actinoplanes rectilineatus TaxID=113571 RepID=UPI0005F2F4D8|nr:NAD(P)/FAD-dependent oxidoreductase [Actinoplanes rectilineatus]
MTDIDVAVVGAGPAGLAVADLLRRAGRDVQVFEAETVVGGRMATLRRDGWTLDRGAEFLSRRGYPATWRLIHRFGLRPGTDVLRMPGVAATWRDGVAYPGLADPFSRHAGGLSARGRAALLRFAADLARPSARLDPDHPERAGVGAATVADLAARYGGELVDRLLAPLVAGMFGWHADRSAAAPLLANLAAVGGQRHWRTYAGGMDTLARRMADRLPVHLGAPVHEVVTDAGTARVSVGTRTWTATTVVIALPAPLALRVHRNPDPDDLPFLAAATYTRAIRLSCLLDRPVHPAGRTPVHMLAVPEAESPLLTGLLADHLRHPGRVPPGRGLVSMLVAPRVAGDLLDTGDTELTDLLTTEAARFLPGLRAATLATVVSRFRYALPECTPAALALRPAFLDRPVRTVEYAGDWLLQRPSSEGAHRSAELTAGRLCAGRSVPLPEVVR